jgi:hypothetical protein
MIFGGLFLCLYSLWSSQFENSVYCLNMGIFIQHCFICRHSDFTVSEDAEIEPRSVVTSALAVRHSIATWLHLIPSWPHLIPTRLHLIPALLHLIPTWLHLIPTRLHLIHLIPTRLQLISSRLHLIPSRLHLKYCLQRF